MTVHADRLWLVERPSTLPVKTVSWEVKTVVLGQKKFFRSRKSNSRRSFPLLTITTRGPLQSYRNDQAYLLNDKFSSALERPNSHS